VRARSGRGWGWGATGEKQKERGQDKRGRPRLSLSHLVVKHALIRQNVFGDVEADRVQEAGVDVELAAVGKLPKLGPPQRPVRDVRFCAERKDVVTEKDRVQVVDGLAWGGGGRVWEENGAAAHFSWPPTARHPVHHPTLYLSPWSTLMLYSCAAPSSCR